MDDIKKLIKQKVREGWELEITKKHRKLWSPEGGFVSFSSSPSCPYVVQKIKQDIKRLDRFNKEKHGNIHRHPAVAGIQEAKGKVPNKNDPRNSR